MRVVKSTLAAALLAAAPPLHAFAVRRLLERNLRALNAGDIEPLLGFYADDATLDFPGEHSWSGRYSGKAEIERFLRRFVAAGLGGELGDVLVQGPPWNARVAIQFNDHARDPRDGTVVYENRALIYARIRWNRIVAEELYEDTQRVPAFDEHLAARGVPVAA